MTSPTMHDLSLFDVEVIDISRADNGMIKIRINGKTTIALYGCHGSSTFSPPRVTLGLIDGVALDKQEAR